MEQEKQGFFKDALMVFLIFALGVMAWFRLVGAGVAMGLALARKMPTGEKRAFFVERMEIVVAYVYMPMVVIVLPWMAISAWIFQWPFLKISLGLLLLTVTIGFILNFMLAWHQRRHGGD
jgi:hypothetical protein